MFALDIYAVVKYEFLTVIDEAVRFWIFAAAVASGKANVFKTPHIVEVLGMTVRNPYGWVILYVLLFGPPPSKNVIPWVVLSVIILLDAGGAVELYCIAPATSRIVIRAPGEFKLDKYTMEFMAVDESICRSVVLLVI
jgi:hypothetical protein